MSRIIIKLGKSRFRITFPKFGWHGLTPRFEQEKVLSLEEFRQFLSNEKARILHLIAVKKPSSLYELAKLLKRDFKAVRQDVKLLEKMGLVKLVKEKKGRREKLKPQLAIERLEIIVELSK